VLHIHRAERADALVDALGALLVDPLPDPFAPEVVAVPTRGMERWLTQRMSTVLGATPGRSDGVCANVDFPFPRSLVRDAVAAASGLDPDDDRWPPERSVWPLLEVVDACLGEPWLRQLATYLGPATDPVRRARRLSSVRHLAELFDRYALHRPEMVRAWAGGRDVDGVQADLAPDLIWQAELWRRLRAQIGQPDPAERLAGACSRLRSDPELVGLPQRISLFGLTRLPAAYLQVLSALAAARDVHLFLLHPSPARWERSRHPRGAEGATNRLLASWGQDACDMQVVLTAAGEHVDHHHPTEHPVGTLLARIQADVQADRSAEDIQPDPGDRSVQIHACHGRARQVEVMRDAILHVLDEDPTLEPRDVIVMCPDIETFAPLIAATFGAGEPLDGEELESLPSDVRPTDLRVRLADRSLRQTNPVLGVVAQLIDLAAERMTASQVLDLADREPVRRRFWFDDDDLTRMQDWVGKSGIRWGLDQAHRAPFKLDHLPAGTWRAGLDRVLVGVTMTEDEQRRFGGVLPLDDVESGAIDLAGRFAEFIDRLHTAVDAFATPPKAIEAWAAAIATAADSLTATNQRDAWQRSELQRLLDAVVREAAGHTTALALAEIRALLAERLQGRPTRANFRTGHLTFCTLAPMRSVPHRVVCLLGLDDGAFPRKAPRDGDDLILDQPQIGDRNPRTEDRQMLLDALLAASDRLIITYTGNDERTNAPKPPAVPVGELLDITGPGVVVRHPLQPFDPRNFRAERPWSFDAVTLDGARALTAPRSQPGPFLAAPLPAVESPTVEIDHLVRFAQHPVRAFLRQRLGVRVADYSDELDDGLSIELDGLGKWGVGQRLLDALLAGVDPRTAALAEIARGTLPPGVLGEPVIEEVFPIAKGIADAAAGLAPGAADSIDVRVKLPDGRLLGGTVAGVGGDLLRTVTYSRVAPKHRLTSWVRLLALTITYPDRAFEAATIGRAGRSSVAVFRIPPIGADSAREHFAELLEIYDAGMREPLPIYCATSAAYARAVHAGDDPKAAVDDAWTSPYNFDKEDKELEHQLVLGGIAGCEALLENPRFDALARRLWRGLLECEAQ